MSLGRGKSKSSGSKDDGIHGFILSVIDGRLSGEEFHFEEACSIGRVETNDVVMIDPGISREHARVSGKRGVYLVEDLGSSNGTRLNGQAISGPEVLRDGDYIALGQATVQFSNLDMSGGGDDTVRMRLSEKQRKKLDHGILGSTAGGNKLKELLATPRGKLLVFGGGGLAFLLLVAGIVNMCGDQKRRGGGSAAELSEQPIDYTNYQAVGYTQWSFGYGPNSQHYRDKVIFDYKKSAPNLRVTLEYSAWGVDDAEEVVILLNGKRVGAVPPTKKHVVKGRGVRYDYVYNLRLALPRDKLKAKNTLVFDNTRNGRDGTDTWEICYVKLREEAIPPVPDPGKAEGHWAKAQTLYETRNVDPANLQKARKQYERARDYVEMLPAAKRPAFYRGAIRQIDQINEELRKIFKQAIFTAQKHRKFGYDDKAKQRLRQAMMYFEANKRDPYYIQLKEALSVLGN